MLRDKLPDPGGRADGGCAVTISPSQVESVAQMLFDEQRRLVDVFADYDRRRGLRVSEWERPRLGGGRACVLEDGGVFERAGINVSLVHGDQVPPVIAERAEWLRGMPYTATGISMVFHPRNPYAPSLHTNFRYFGVGEAGWWFGGGADLTPAYGFDIDVVHFHRTLKAWCDRHDPTWYPQWKATCDDYFTIPHRSEMRGVGGVFFDNVTDGGPDGFERLRQFAADGIATILPAYLPILDRRHGMPYGERERSWQLNRRGRYVEFNLVYDRGTRFGLQTRGNTEAILMSLPPLARWGFEMRPEPGSPEHELARFLQPSDWARR
jgi:coproporphyrinogen III oxidase